jgi:hypothetical protein
MPSQAPASHRSHRGTVRAQSTTDTTIAGESTAGGGTTEVDDGTTAVGTSSEGGDPTGGSGRCARRGGEKFNRFRSAEIGVEPTGGLDYPLGWSAAGGFGLSGTQDGGEISLFGNSVASDDAIHFGYAYAMPRGEWHAFELELRLGAPGGNDGETRLFIDGGLVAEATGLGLRPQTDATIDRIWIGGWYSNLGVDPDPAPAVRYVDDVTVCAEHIGP